MVGANALEKNSLVFVKYGAPSDLSNTCNFFSFLLYYYGNILKKFMVSCNKFNVSVSTNSCILQNTSVPLIHHTRSLKRSLFFYIILDVILINDLLRLARPIQCASLHAITTTITWSTLIGS